jgi:hypothetical protein
MPAELKPPSSEGKTREEQQSNRALRERRKPWEERWRQEHYPAFFRHFCAHYLYRMPPEKR